MYSKTLLVFVVVYFLSGSARGQRDMKFFRYDYTYLEKLAAFYKIHTAKQTWANAKRECSQEGASFFHPENSTEAEAIISFMTSQNDLPYIIVGLSDILVEGLFETVDGKSVSEVFHKWRPGQPDDYRNAQDCAYLFKSGDMDDGSCDDKVYFICKKSLQSLEWNYDCKIPNLDYTLNRDIGKCYKVHTTPVNWMEAHAICRSEQSYLAVINNRMEADYLATLADSSSNEIVGGNYMRGLFHLGFHNKLFEGWQTVRGTPFSYANGWWGNYQPEANSSEQCGSMFYTGRLTHVDCNLKSFFICEHEVDSSNSTALAEEQSLQLN